ncbi:hypothetical protein [Flammeovirga sp. EKP202]|uniref:hypothetical protein n=1 Tax=Flammeovirga sp. EKP202 TaxID=2770592 RepID=UPI00165F4576|nr:hypothetical protein [Flammeovirga sp. EKP202]MBD0400650.1 hypothetical protein [Flammeovirga sp. EKP202]
MEVLFNSKSYNLRFDHTTDLNSNRQYIASTNGDILSRLSLFKYDVGEPLPEGGRISHIISFDEMGQLVQLELDKLPKRRRKKKEDE